MRVSEESVFVFVFGRKGEGEGKRYLWFGVWGVLEIGVLPSSG